MLKFLLIANKQGQLRLSHHFDRIENDSRITFETDVIKNCIGRTDNQCSFIECRDKKIVYRQYASLYFIIGVENSENELAILEFIHLFVETLDSYFDKVTELHIMFNLDKVHLIIQEMIVNGQIAEISKNRVLNLLQLIDKLESK